MNKNTICCTCTFKSGHPQDAQKLICLNLVYIIELLGHRTTLEARQIKQSKPQLTQNEQMEKTERIFGDF